jgi:ABC-type phosphate transport system auxiliary subunit
VCRYRAASDSLREEKSSRQATVDKLLVQIDALREQQDARGEAQQEEKKRLEAERNQLELRVKCHLLN